MKLIFLDVDGVLNHNKSRMDLLTGKSHFILDEDCIDNLYRIIDATNAYIVISSTWRLGAGRLILEKSLPQERVIGSTPWISLNDRKTEILHWLQNVWPCSHGWASRTITKLAVIDDDIDADLGDGSFFLTDAENGGLTKEISERIINYLNEP